MRELFTRKRREGDTQLPYSDCYDEIIDGIRSGKVISGSTTTGTHTVYHYVDHDSISENVGTINWMMDKEIPKSLDPQPSNEEGQVVKYIMCVSHHYKDEDISDIVMDVRPSQKYMDQYRELLDSHFWNGFVKSISVKEV